MNNYSKLYLVKVPVAFLIRSDEEFCKTMAYSVLDNMSEAAFESGDSIAFGELTVEEVF